jgi:hypothetical protein
MKNAPRVSQSDNKGSKLTGPAVDYDNDTNQDYKNGFATTGVKSTGKDSEDVNDSTKGPKHIEQKEFDAKESSKQNAAKSTKRQVYGSENGGFTSNSNPKARSYATSGVKNDVIEGKR